MNSFVRDGSGRGRESGAGGAEYMASVAAAVGGHVLDELILGALLFLPQISIWETNRPLG